jgi:threonine/homoserine/homoserine lactone efflux protein
MNLNHWLLIVAAAIGLSVTPGPNSLLALTHGALHGHRRTLYTVAGGAVGFTALIALSMLGIGALLQTSAQALTVLKLAGGAYLVWLGVQLWRAPAIRLQADGAPADARPRALFRQGLLTAVSNPKALLFYGAFLPQFIDPRLPLMTQFVVMWSRSSSNGCWRCWPTVCGPGCSGWGAASTAPVAGSSSPWAWRCR